MQSKLCLRYVLLIFFGVTLLGSCGKHSLVETRLGMGCCNSTLAEDEVSQDRRPLLASPKQQNDSSGTPAIIFSTSSPSLACITQEQDAPSSMVVAANREQPGSHTPTTNASTASASQTQADTLRASTLENSIPVRVVVRSQDSNRTIAHPTRTTRANSRSSSSVKSAPAAMQVPLQNAGRDREEDSTKSRRSKAASNKSVVRRRNRINFPQTSRVNNLSQNIHFDENSVGSSLASIGEDMVCEFSFDEGVAVFLNRNVILENTGRNAGSESENSAVVSLVSMPSDSEIENGTVVSLVSMPPNLESENRTVVSPVSTPSDSESKNRTVISLVSTPSET